jgi:hypothetical protein
MNRFLSACLLLLTAGPCEHAGAQCCASRATAAAGWEWRTYPAAQFLGLFQFGRQVGCWKPATGYLPLLDGDTWGAACEPPVPLPDLAGLAVRPPCRCNRDCPCGRACDCYRQGKCSPACPCGRKETYEGCQVDSDGTLNFGVDHREPSGTTSYSLSGRPATREQVLAALAGGGQVPDDRALWCLTVIGPEAARKQVLADLDGAPELAGWKGRLKVKAYAPDHWAVSRCGFKCDGNPTVYLQAPDGRVLHRQDDYAGGAPALARALRQADPNYKPGADPDRRQTPSVLPAGVPWSVPVALVLAGVALFANRRKP